VCGFLTSSVTCLFQHLNSVTSVIQFVLWKQLKQLALYSTVFISRFLRTALYFCSCTESVVKEPGWTLPTPEFDWMYLCNLDNTDRIKMNIRHRKGVGDIDRVVSEISALSSSGETTCCLRKLC
jgi:hypothetical protein